MAYYVGVDIGGTNIKAGVVDDDSKKIISELSIPTGAHRNQNIVLQDILKIINDVTQNANLKISDIAAVGMGSPGWVETKNGTVVYNNNLGWRDFKIAVLVHDNLKIPAVIVNDADAAALGEVVAGSAKGAESAIIITLGTGVGVGIVVNQKIWHGSEFGHMTIQRGGRLCTCGKRGCFEAYASATGLINMTKDAIKENPNSTLAEIAEIYGEVTGLTAFEAAEKGSSTAEKVIDEYISYLACGLVNLIDGLHPEIISLGGGIAKQGEKLLTPLREKIALEVYGEPGKKINPTKIVNCTLGYKAGVIGAAMAAKNE